MDAIHRSWAVRGIDDEIASLQRKAKKARARVRHLTPAYREACEFCAMAYESAIAALQRFVNDKAATGGGEG